jgi:hypothetical protein
MNSNSADKLIVLNEFSVGLADESDKAKSKCGEVDLETAASGGRVLDDRAAIFDTSGQSISAVIGTNSMQGWFPSRTLWDTVVNFGTGDTVTIWGPNFSLTFATNQGSMDYVGPTLRAPEPGNLLISVSFADKSMAVVYNNSLVQMFDAKQSKGGSHASFQGMNEPSSQYITTTKTARRIAIPQGITLTPRVLLGALLKMPTMEIENTIENLIAELDNRGGNLDDEPEVDEASLRV